VRNGLSPEQETDPPRKWSKGGSASVEATASNIWRWSCRKSWQRFSRLSGDEPWGEGDIPLLMVVKQARPTVIIGCSTAPGSFDQTLVKATLDATDSVEMPIFLPLSNPTDLAEGKPADILSWAHGRALVATGSPFPKVQVTLIGRSPYRTRSWFDSSAIPTGDRHDAHSWGEKACSSVSCRQES